MTKLLQRIQKLEKRVLPPPESEFDRYLRTRLEAARRRVAELRAEPGPVEHPTASVVAAPVHGQPGFLRNDLATRLYRGRDRARYQSLTENCHAAWPDAIVEVPASPAGFSR
jgi:hypothetical protein